MKGLKCLSICTCVMLAVMGAAACHHNTEEPVIRTEDLAESEGKAGDRPVIRLWHIYGSDDDEAARIMRQLTAEAEEKFHVSIVVDTAENEGYKTKIKAAAAANELPDIFYTWSHEFLKPMVDAGKVLEVSRYYSEDFAKHLNYAMMSGIRFDGGTYGLPLDNSVAMIYYNMEMMDRYGLSIPYTWDEFLHVCRTFVDHGITPMPVGGNEPWTIAMYYDLLALREVGPEGVADAASGKTDYSDPGFLEAARKLRQLVDMGAFPADSPTALREEAEALFMQGEAPMYLNGSWTSSRVYRETSKVAGIVRAAPFPVTGSGKSTIYDFTGGPDSAFAVSSRTEDPELTMELAEYLSMGLAVELYKCKSSDIPYVDVDTGGAKLNPLMQEIHEYTDHAESYTIWWDNLLDGMSAAAYLENLQRLFGKEITPEEFVQRLNEHLAKKEEADDGSEVCYRQVWHAQRQVRTGLQG